MRAVIRLLITKYILKQGGICSSWNADLRTEELMDITVTISIKIIPKVPTILDSTLASAWFGDCLKDRTAQCTNNTC